MVPQAGLQFDTCAHDPARKTKQHRGIVIGAMRVRINDFVDWASAESARHDLAHETIPQCREPLIRPQYLASDSNNGRRRASRPAGPLAERTDRVLRDRQLAEEWTYRRLAAAHAWPITEHGVLQRISLTKTDVNDLGLDQAVAGRNHAPLRSRAWARPTGVPVPDPGRRHPGNLACMPRRQRREPTAQRRPGTTLISGSKTYPGSHRTRCASNPDTSFVPGDTLLTSTPRTELQRYSAITL
jgi:hypothetical protein